MNLAEYIGYPKAEVIKFVEKQKIEYKVVNFNENLNFDIELFVKFQYINNILTLYFDKFTLNPMLSK